MAFYGVKRAFFSGTGAIAFEHTPTVNIKLSRIVVHLSSAATQDSIVVWIDGASGTDYNVCASTAMAGETEYECDLSGQDYYLMAGDTLKVDFANNDGLTVNGELIYED